VRKHLASPDLELSLNWTSLPAMIFFSSALRRTSRTMLLDRPFNSFCRTEKSVVPSAAGTTISLALSCAEASARY
jgi:hypothetical protein